MVIMTSGGVSSRLSVLWERGGRLRPGCCVVCVESCVLGTLRMVVVVGKLSSPPTATTHQQQQQQHIPFLPFFKKGKGWHCRHIFDNKVYHLISKKEGHGETITDLHTVFVFLLLFFAFFSFSLFAFR